MHRNHTSVPAIEPSASPNDRGVRQWLYASGRRKKGASARDRSAACHGGGRYPCNDCLASRRAAAKGNQPSVGRNYDRENGGRPEFLPPVARRVPFLLVWPCLS